MTQIPNINNAQANNQSSSSASALNDVNVDDFLQLMITELQNQDPLNPLDNADLLAQISQIRSVGATEQLTETLGAVLLGQNISSATNLIGAQIEAITDDGQRVNGVVDRVSIANGEPKLHLNLEPNADASGEEGDLQAGTYDYRVVWNDEAGNLFSVELDPITTTGEAGVDQAVLLSNLPATSTAKRVYRTDQSGSGNYRLVATLTDGSQATYLDTTSDANLSQSVLVGAPSPIDSERNFTVSLRNVGEIRSPGS